MRYLLKLSLALLALTYMAVAQDMPSWNDTKTREAIIEFVKTTTDESSPDFIPPAERIAVFDNDGTLWAEKPFYFQLYYALDRLKELSKKHPEWATEQPFKAALEGDMKTLASTGKEGLFKVLMATHGGETTEEFEQHVKAWVGRARHPKTGRKYTEMVYQPMLELLDYLRANGFRTYIVSGGGVEFMRAFAEEVYGIPPEQVIGSSIAHRFEIRNEKPVLVRRHKLDFIDDKEGKPIAINRIIGRRPVIAAGNSDGDLQMLQWTAAGKAKSLNLLVHHTDGKREWQYDRKSHVGRLDQALDEAEEKRWTVIDMAKDWNAMFPGRTTR